jgi:hypothetical protein
MLSEKANHMVRNFAAQLRTVNVELATVCNFTCKKAPKTGLFVASLQLANPYQSID